MAPRTAAARNSAFHLAFLAGIALVGCSDHSVNPIVEPLPPEGPTSCEDAWADYEAVDDVVSCGIGPGWSEPELRWFLPNVNATGAGPLVDTDGDGRVTIHDESMIFGQVRGSDSWEHSLVVLDPRGVQRAAQPTLTASAYFDARNGSGYRVYGYMNSRSTTRHGVGWRPGSANIDVTSNLNYLHTAFGASAVSPLQVGDPPVFARSDGRVATLDGAQLRDRPTEHDNRGGGAPVIVDLDGDGAAEIVYGHGVLDSDLQIDCVRDHLLEDLAVIDLTGGGRAVTVGVIAGLPFDYSGPLRRGEVFLFDRCRQGVPVYRGHGTESLGVRHIAIGDLTGDGRPEIVIPDRAFGVTAVRPDGSTVWRRPGFARSLRELSLADLDGDGALEVVLPSGLILDGATGATLADLTAPTADLDGDLPDTDGRGAMVVDLEGDGRAEILLNTSDGLYVFDGARGWAPGPRCTWQGDIANMAALDPQCRLPDRPRGPDDLPRTFRAVTPPPYAPWTGGELAVRFADLCEAECNEGRLRAIVQVGNLGSLDIDRPIEVRLTGVRDGEGILLGIEEVPFIPAATWLPGVEFQVEVDAGFDDLSAQVRPVGWRLRQCDISFRDVSVGFRVCRELQ